MNEFVQGHLARWGGHPTGGHPPPTASDGGFKPTLLPPRAQAATLGEKGFSGIPPEACGPRPCDLSLPRGRSVPCGTCLSPVPRAHPLSLAARLRLSGRNASWICDMSACSCEQASLSLSPECGFLCACVHACACSKGPVASGKGGERDPGLCSVC